MPETMDCTVCFRLRDEHHFYSKHSSSALHVLAVVRQQHNMKHVFEPASQAYYDLSTFPLQKIHWLGTEDKANRDLLLFPLERSAIQSEPRNVEIRTKRILLYIRFCAEARMPHSGTEAICGTETKSSIQTTSGTQSKCEIETKSQSKRNPAP